MTPPSSPWWRSAPAPALLLAAAVAAVAAAVSRSAGSSSATSAPAPAPASSSSAPSWPLAAQQAAVDLWSARPLAELHEAAERGDAAASAVLGNALAFGRLGLAPDRAAAAQWYGRAAAAGLARAQNSLGFALANGAGVARDEAAAARLYARAAAQGLAAAQLNLGNALRAGAGVARDQAAAEAQWRAAAAQGFAEAQNALALALLAGGGGGDDGAGGNRGSGAASAAPAAADSGGPPRKFGPDAEAEARLWACRAADQGHTAGSYNCGVLLARAGQAGAAAVRLGAAARGGHAEARAALRELAVQGVDGAAVELRKLVDSVAAASVETAAAPPNKA